MHLSVGHYPSWEFQQLPSLGHVAMGTKECTRASKKGLTPSNPPFHAAKCVSIIQSQRFNYLFLYAGSCAVWSSRWCCPQTCPPIYSKSKLWKPVYSSKNGNSVPQTLLPVQRSWPEGGLRDTELRQRGRSWHGSYLCPEIESEHQQVWCCLQQDWQAQSTVPVTPHGRHQPSIEALAAALSLDKSTDGGVLPAGRKSDTCPFVLSGQIDLFLHFMSLHVAFGQIPISVQKRLKKTRVFRTSCLPSCKDRIWFSRVTPWRTKRNGTEEVWDDSFEKQHMRSLSAKSLKFALKHCSACIKQPFQAIFGAVWDAL